MSEKNKIRLGIIFGGKSGEHEVSLMSAASVIRAVNKEKYDLYVTYWKTARCHPGRCYC